MYISSPLHGLLLLGLCLYSTKVLAVSDERFKLVLMYTAFFILSATIQEIVLSYNLDYSLTVFSSALFIVILFDYACSMKRGPWVNTFCFLQLFAIINAIVMFVSYTTGILYGLVSQLDGLLFFVLSIADGFCLIGIVNGRKQCNSVCERQYFVNMASFKSFKSSLQAYQATEWAERAANRSRKTGN